MKKTVVFILSANYSGSHYLSLMLGSHSRVLHLGEVKNLVKAGNLGRTPDRRTGASKQCYLCGDNNACRLFRDAHHWPATGIYERLFERAGEQTDLLVDTSKKVAWARRFPARPDYRPVFIHLLRDPRALVRKWQLLFAGPGLQWRQRRRQLMKHPAQALRILRGPQWAVYVLKWLQQNREITAFIRQARRPAYVLTYHDLATQTEATLTRLMQWLGLEYEVTQPRYWLQEHHGTRKPGYDWIDNSDGSCFDLRWQEDLPAEVQQAIATHPLVREYLDEAGVEIIADGLTRPRPGVITD